MKHLTLVLFATSMFIYGCTNGNAKTNETDKKEQVPLSTAASTGTVKSTVVKSTSTAKTAEKPKFEPLVTFVELGSVNCIPCKMMQPVMKEIEETYKGKVKVVFYDVWTAAGRPYTEKYSIRAIPTQIFLDKDGKEFHRHEGFYPKEEIVKILEKQGVKQ